MQRKCRLGGLGIQYVYLVNQIAHGDQCIVLLYLWCKRHPIRSVHYEVETRLSLLFESYFEGPVPAK